MITTHDQRESAMQVFEKNGMHIYYREEGDPDGAPLVFSNSLGTDMRLWDAVIPSLPQGLRVVRYDMRGHGLSDCPNAPYSMGALISDVEALLDHLNISNCLFVGLSIGGMIAQGLATKRLDLIRAKGFIKYSCQNCHTRHMARPDRQHSRDGHRSSIRRYHAPMV
jgi:3-oxoadipate enol-lactonase